MTSWRGTEKRLIVRPDKPHAEKNTDIVFGVVVSSAYTDFFENKIVAYKDYNATPLTEDLVILEAEHVLAHKEHAP